MKQTVLRVYLDSITCSADVPVNDIGEHRIELVSHKSEVSAVFAVLPNSFQIPERRINRVVLGRLPRVGEDVGQHATVYMFCESQQNVACDFIVTGDERQTGKRNHRVASPIAEPVVAGNDGLQRSAPRDELIGRQGERLDKVVFRWRRFADLAAPLTLVLLKYWCVRCIVWFG